MGAPNPPTNITPTNIAPTNITPTNITPPYRNGYAQSSY